MEENAIILTDHDLLKYGLDSLSDACCNFFEIETPEGKAIAFMADAVLRYAQAIYYDRDPLLSEEFYASQREQTESPSKRQ